MPLPSRWICGLLALGIGFGITSCGRKAPFFAPQPQEGDLAVSSSPAGASILLDGTPTGLTTPDTLRALAGGEHVVRLSLWGWTVAPESLVVSVSGGSLAEADFSLVPATSGPPKIVLLEAFSNVDCTGCPEMSANVEALMESPGHGTDRVLMIKYSTGSPAISDPHYQANIEDNEERRTYYFPGTAAITIPTLLADGALLGDLGVPPDLTSLTPQVDALLAADPGFAVAVAAEIHTSDVSGTVSLTATRHVDLSGCALRVALVENPIVYGRPPGSQDETVFHWVMRDLVVAAAILSSPEESTPLAYPFTLQRNISWVEANLYVVAFVQHETTRQILQAGSTATAGKTGERRVPQTAKPFSNPRSPTGGQRP
jgi:hypothetical protein